MSYTLRGRLETRAATSLLPLLVAAALAGVLHRSWPVGLAVLMLGVGLTLDAAVYHRLLDYQAGWLAVPLGLCEVGLLLGLTRLADVRAPLAPAVVFFAGSWLLAQLLVHGGFPLWRLSYGESGGELDRAGPALGACCLAVLAGAGGAFWATRPPTVHLAAGVHGPIVITRSETLVGAPGAVIRGGVVVRASNVTLRDLRIVGGDNGIDVENVHGVHIERVRVSGAALDGIHVRAASASIRDCRVDSGGNLYGQGIDVSYSMGLPNSVEDCTVTGGREGIVTHSAMVDVRDNRVSRTALRGITMTEMSMGRVDGNDVDGALGVGIFCGDHSECTIDGNSVSGTRDDRASGDRTRAGYGIVAHYGATAEVRGNHLHGNAAGVGTFLEAQVRRG